MIKRLAKQQYRGIPGDEAPVVSIDITGNKTFLFSRKQVQYTLSYDNNDSANKKNLNIISFLRLPWSGGKWMGHRTVQKPS